MAEIPRTYSSETELTSLTDIFYRREYMGTSLLELMAPELIFDRLWPKIQVPTQSVSIPKQTASGTRFSDASDTRKEYAPGWTPGAEIPSVTVTPGEYESHTLRAYAEGFTVPMEGKANIINIDWIAKTRRRIG